MYSVSIITLSVGPVLSVSTEKLTKPVKMFAKRKNPSWLKSTADTKHTLEHLTCLVVGSPSLRGRGGDWVGVAVGVVCGEGRGLWRMKH